MLGPRQDFARRTRTWGPDARSPDNVASVVAFAGVRCVFDRAEEKAEEQGPDSGRSEQQFNKRYTDSPQAQISGCPESKMLSTFHKIAD